MRLRPSSAEQARTLELFVIGGSNFADPTTSTDTRTIALVTERRDAFVLNAVVGDEPGQGQMRRAALPPVSA